MHSRQKLQRDLHYWPNQNLNSQRKLYQFKRYYPMLTLANQIHLTFQRVLEAHLIAQ